jgi:regulator of cell morphogenesis and NO signaling
MMTQEVLDVTAIEPRLKHPTIFQHFDQLQPGEHFVIHNDHDPRPLYYQLLAERGNIFTWNYLLDGPEYWEVKIGKAENGQTSATIGEIVSKDFRKAEVFKKFGLDFCCGGKKTLQKASQDKGLDILEVQKELEKAEHHPAVANQNFSEWNLGFLVDYIVNAHHQYVKKAMPVIFEYTQKVARVHGANHPEAVEIANVFEEIVNEMTQHMMKEEEILFPYIKKLTLSQDTAIKPPAAFGSVQNPIRMMEHEHEDVGNLIKRINLLSSSYNPPSDACTTFRLSYAKMKEFEEDLHQHMHLENNILFPKAIELEKRINGN